MERFWQVNDVLVTKLQTIGTQLSLGSSKWSESLNSVDFSLTRDLTVLFRQLRTLWIFERMLSTFLDGISEERISPSLFDDSLMVLAGIFGTSWASSRIFEAWSEIAQQRIFFGGGAFLYFFICSLRWQKSRIKMILIDSLWFDTIIYGILFFHFLYLMSEGCWNTDQLESPAWWRIGHISGVSEMINKWSEWTKTALQRQ